MDRKKVVSKQSIMLTTLSNESCMDLVFCLMTTLRKYSFKCYVLLNRSTSPTFNFFYSVFIYKFMVLLCCYFLSKFPQILCGNENVK